MYPWRTLSPQAHCGGRGSGVGGLTTGAALLSRVLARPGCALLDLYLFANALQDSGTEALSVGLRSNCSLTKLNLCGNQIGAQGAAALGLALAAHPTLTQCDLNCNELTDQGVRADWATTAHAALVSCCAEC